MQDDKLSKAETLDLETGSKELSAGNSFQSKVLHQETDHSKPRSFEALL